MYMGSLAHDADLYCNASRFRINRVF